VVTEEVDLKTFGNTADVDLPGALIQVTSNPAVISSMDGTQDQVFQSTNLDAA
jgi:hypothetical protein